MKTLNDIGAESGMMRLILPRNDGVIAVLGIVGLLPIPPIKGIGNAALLIGLALVVFSGPKVLRKQQ